MPAAAQETPKALDQEQWELTYEVIKSKVQALVEENTSLTTQYEALLLQQAKLQKAIEQLAGRSQELKEILRARGGKTDEQIRLAQLERALQLKKSQLARREGQARVLKARAGLWQRKVNAKQMKISAMELRQQTAKAEAAASARPLSPPPPPRNEALESSDLASLRRDLEGQKAREAALEDEISSLSVQMVDPEVGQLQQKIDLLKFQKERLLAKAAAQKPPSTGQLKYAALVSQKLQMEDKIHEVEGRIGVLKKALVSGFSWTMEKKQLIHDIVQADADNGQLREKVNDLRQDIGVLQDQVARLEAGQSFQAAR